MAIKTGTITARPTLHAYGNSYISDVDDMIAGTGVIGATWNSSSSGYGIAYLYGFNFETLRDRQKLKITGLKVSFSAMQYNSSATFESAAFNFAADFTSRTDYTDLGDGSITVVAKNGATSEYEVYSVTETQMPNTLQWINSNLDKFLNGYTSKTFGLRLYLKRIYISDITITVTYEYEETPPEFTSAEMLYSDKQISQSNKVIADEGFVISIGVT